MITRNTRQKEIIQKEINSFNTIFTVEELYEKVNRIDSKIGLATLYRFLKTLRNQRRIFFYRCGNRNVYSHEKRGHCHFICEGTGDIIHFEVDSLDFLKDKIPGSITSFLIEIRGICNKCSMNQNKSQ